jgi:phospholipid transport system transporter-binding protein
MTAAKLQSESNQRAYLNGDLNSATVTALARQGTELIRNSGGKWSLDMSAVEHASSAGVALLLEWMRVADASGVALTIEHLPDHMRPILAVSDLDDVFKPLLA